MWKMMFSSSQHRNLHFDIHDFSHLGDMLSQALKLAPLSALAILAILGAILGPSWGLLGPSWKLENGVFAWEVCNKWEVGDTKLSLF